MNSKILVLIALAIGAAVLVGLGMSSRPEPIQIPTLSPRPTVIMSPEPEPDISPLPIPSPTPVPPPPASPLPSEIPATVGAPFRLAFGQSARIAEEDMMLMFAAVLEDSRCPTDVTCVWEGQATVDVAVGMDGEDLGLRTLTARAGHEDLAVKHASGFEIRLLGVSPTPVSTRTIAQNEYVIKLLVSRSNPVP